MRRAKVTALLNWKIMRLLYNEKNLRSFIVSSSYSEHKA